MWEPGSGAWITFRGSPTASLEPAPADLRTNGQWRKATGHWRTRVPRHTALGNSSTGLLPPAGRSATVRHRARRRGRPAQRAITQKGQSGETNSHGSLRRSSFPLDGSSGGGAYSDSHATRQGGGGRRPHRETLDPRALSCASTGSVRGSIRRRGGLCTAGVCSVP